MKKTLKISIMVITIMFAIMLTKQVKAADYEDAQVQYIKDTVDESIYTVQITFDEQITQQQKNDSLGDWQVEGNIATKSLSQGSADYIRLQFDEGIQEAYIAVPVQAEVGQTIHLAGLSGLGTISSITMNGLGTIDGTDIIIGTQTGITEYSVEIENELFNKNNHEYSFKFPLLIVNTSQPDIENPQEPIMKKAQIQYGEITPDGVEVILTFENELSEDSLSDKWVKSGKIAKTIMQPGDIACIAVAFNNATIETADIFVPITLEINEIIDISDIGANLSIENSEIASLSNGGKLKGITLGKTFLNALSTISSPITDGNLDIPEVNTYIQGKWEVKVVEKKFIQNEDKQPQKQDNINDENKNPQPENNNKKPETNQNNENKSGYIIQAGTCSIIVFVLIGIATIIGFVSYKKNKKNKLV